MFRHAISRAACNLSVRHRCLARRSLNSQGFGFDVTLFSFRFEHCNVLFDLKIAACFRVLARLHTQVLEFLETACYVFS